MSEEEADAIHPPIEERVWYKNHQTQERGYLCSVATVQHLCVNSPGGERFVRVSDSWSVDRDYRPLSVAALGQALFEADRAICRALGHYSQAKREWYDIKEKEKLHWMKKGPPGKVEKLRLRVSADIRKHLKKISGSVNG